MAKIELKDFSKTDVENKALYGKLKDINLITLDSSICEVVGDDKTIKPILEIRKSKEENKVEITTFGFVGRFSYASQEFDISYRFGEVVLERMITKVNDFDVKTLEYEAKDSKNKNQTDSLALKILYLNFILKLEKLSILGIPKSYKRIEHHSDKLKGQIDINRFIKKDIPYTGKISSTSHEQTYVQEILDVLYGALIIVEKSMRELVGKRLFQIRNLISHYANRRFVDERTIENAIYHKSIQNSLYRDFKTLLEISSYIIRHNNKQEYKASNIMSGLIFDVSLLWENYLYVLLKKNIEDENWKVLHEDLLEVYKDKFYARKMKPDIVIKNESDKKVLVFDAKSKSMTMQGRNQNGAGDVDRADFFQINTYMSYYKNNGYTVIAGGLLYPIEKEFDKSTCHSEHWFGDKETKFIVDGIDLTSIQENLKIEDLVKAEKAFVERICKLLAKT